jgi:hypothetical protein
MRVPTRSAWAAASAVAITTLALLVAAPASAQAPTTLSAVGSGSAGAARVVNVATLDAGPQVLASSSAPHATLGRNGRPTGESLPTVSTQGTKHVPTTSTAPPAAGSPNSGGGSVGPLTAPSTQQANFAGVSQGGSNCGGCQPPDVNAALSPSQVVETVNLRFQVFTRAGARTCGSSLNTFLNTTNSLSDPRVQWDNRANRFSLVAIPIPTSSSSTPAMFIAASRSSDACGTWNVYRVTFSGGPFPAGTLLDYPYIGQDRVALLSSSNNFQGNSYIGSTAFSVPKSAIYSGAGFSFPAFSVAFSTAPVQVAGNPMPSTTNTFFLASAPGFGYRLYRMTNSAGPGTTLSLQANISSPFNAPSRRVRQPGTTQTLDPLDGRIVWSPFQNAGFVWFAHGTDISGFPGVRYGAVSTSANTATVQNVFRSGSSDDFNPSIGVGPQTPGSTGVNIFVNWAFTDTAASVPTTAIVNGVLPGGGVPSLVGGGRIIRQGFSTSSNFRFGDYSSVSIDPGSPCRAAVAQEIFSSTGQWTTRIARIGFC